MSGGFKNDKDLEVTVYKDEVQKLLKSYKKIKKYMKSSLYTLKTLDGTEEVVSELLKELEDKPIDS